LNGDGIPELIVQNQARTFLFGLQRTFNGGVETVWSVPLNAPINSNIALITACGGGSGGENNNTQPPQVLFGTDNSELLRIVFDQASNNGNPPSAIPSTSSSAVSAAWLPIWVYTFLSILPWILRKG
jgi:hypothetical protein